MYKFDYIVIGSGLAGLYAAYKASKYGKVAIVTKCNINENNSYYAQGGIAAVTNNLDSTELHIKDTIIAGRGLCNKEAVEVLAKEAPLRIQELIKEGMEFDSVNGQLTLGLEGGHSKRRILHAGGDITGRRVMEFMISKVRASKEITILENYNVLQLISSKTTCYGVNCWDEKKERSEIILASYTIIATGGASAIYKRSTNPQSSVGDGIAIAFNAGCEIMDIEFIQFHPTTLYTPQNRSFLISEAVRGEGAFLLNCNGDRFMDGIHPLKELAPRDIVSQEIYKQPGGFAYLSLKHLDPTHIKSRFPHIYKQCKDIGEDLTDQIPVAPAAHYTIGGIYTNLHSKTSLDNLYACGEVAANGLMGANRLASNSLAECLVFGARAVEDSLKQSFNNTIEPQNIDYYKDNGNFACYLELSDKVKTILTESAGIIRSEKKISNGLEKINHLMSTIKDTKEYYSILSSNILVVAKLILTGAINRNESRGGHFREDFNKEDSKAYHTIQKKGEEVKKIYR